VVKNAIAAMLLLSLGSTSAQNLRYFPDLAFDENPQQNEQVAQGYTQFLKALQEPSLLDEAKTGTEAYRFLWLRSFHNPIAVRLNMNKDGTSLLTVKVTSGRGGYEPGKLTKTTARELSTRETEWFLSRVQELGYWDLPTREPKNDVIGLDGAMWVLEAVKGGKYKVVDRWSPEKGPVRVLGLMMLIDMAKLKLLYQDVY